MQILAGAQIGIQMQQGQEEAYRDKHRHTRAYRGIQGIQSYTGTNMGIHGHTEEY